jgi:hypothetical protein
MSIKGKDEVGLVNKIAVIEEKGREKLVREL